MPRYDHAEDMFYIEYAGKDLSLDEAEAMLKEFALIIHRLKTENEMLAAGVNHQMKVAVDLRKIEADLRSCMSAWALKLSEMGGYDHKGKNEVILAVVHDLLSVARPRLEGRDRDDIPF